MKYFVNYDFHCICKSDTKPEPIRKNRRYDHDLSEWVEVDKDTYNYVYNIFYQEAMSL